MPCSAGFVPVTEPDPEVTPLDLLRAYAVQDSFEALRDHMTGAMLFEDKKRIRLWCLQQAVAALGTDGLIAEFGVWRGHGVNLFARQLARSKVTIWGFDSFEGLEEDWTGHTRGVEKGRYSLEGVLPQVKGNVQLIKGWVQDTVPGWLSDHPAAPLIFAHMDLDTYTPTRFVLDALRPRLVVGSVLLFDELYGYPGWRGHEYKALQEALPKDSYRYIAFSGQAVGIMITRVD